MRRPTSPRPGRERGKESLGWMRPPFSATRSLKSNEPFPGKGFAEKGARWLNMSLPSNYSLAKRKEFAKLCFQEAIRICNNASIRMKRAGKGTESKRLAEIASWLEVQYFNQL